MKYFNKRGDRHIENPINKKRENGILWNIYQKRGNWKRKKTKRIRKENRKTLTKKFSNRKLSSGFLAKEKKYY